MTRQLTEEWAADTSQFTPHQFQTRALLSVSFNAMWNWMRTHFISYRRGIQEHGLSWVIVGIEVEYHDRVTYFDADGFETVVEAVKLRKNRMLDFKVEFQIPGKRIATVQIRLFALKVTDEHSLSAVPSRVDKPLLNLFSSDEIDGYTRLGLNGAWLQHIETTGRLLGAGVYPFSIHRHLCEVADQWCFIELAGLVGAGREALVAAHPNEAGDLLRGLSSPMKRFNAELKHAYFFFDEGRVETTSYLLNEGVYFIHRLHSRHNRDETYATVLEQF